MDPNAALAAIRQAIDQLEHEKLDRDDEIPALYAVVEQFRALDQWLSAGGFTPHAWHQQRRPDFTWMSVEFVRHVRRLTPGLDRNGTDVSGEPEILQIAEGDMGLVIEDEQGRQVIFDGTPEAVQRLTTHLQGLARRGITVTEPAWRIEPLGGPVPGANGSHLPEHDDA